MSTITEQDIFLVQKDILISLIENYEGSTYDMRNNLTAVSSRMTNDILDSSLKHYKDFIKSQQLLLEKQIC